MSDRVGWGHYIKPSLGNSVPRLGVNCSASQENGADRWPAILCHKQSEYCGILDNMVEQFGDCRLFILVLLEDLGGLGFEKRTMLNNTGMKEWVIFFYPFHVYHNLKIIHIFPPVHLGLLVLRNVGLLYGRHCKKKMCCSVG